MSDLVGNQNVGFLMTRLIFLMPSNVLPSYQTGLIQLEYSLLNNNGNYRRKVHLLMPGVAIMILEKTTCVIADLAATLDSPSLLPLSSNIGTPCNTSLSIYKMSRIMRKHFFAYA